MTKKSKAKARAPGKDEHVLEKRDTIADTTAQADMGKPSKITRAVRPDAAEPAEDMTGTMMRMFKENLETDLRGPHGHPTLAERTRKEIMARRAARASKKAAAK